MACIFCGIASGELPAKVLFEDDDLLAFHDVNPQAPHHVLVIPRRHVKDLNGIDDTDEAFLGRLILAARRAAGLLGMKERGYRIVINTGDEGGQTVSHLHVHAIGGRQMTWPPG